MRYLRSGLADDDLAEIFGDSASQAGTGRGKVGYLEHLVGETGNGTANLGTIRNGTLEVSAEGDRLRVAVNGTAISEGDILAKNGKPLAAPLCWLPEGGFADHRNCRRHPHCPSSPPSLGLARAYGREVPDRARSDALCRFAALGESVALCPDSVERTRHRDRYAAATAGTGSGTAASPA